MRSRSRHSNPAAEGPGTSKGSLAILPVLMLAVFAVALGFGVLLPQLPTIVERLLGAAATPTQIGRTTGWMTALYMLALFFFATVWGGLSDRIGRRVILVIGLSGFGLTIIASSLFESIAALYLERALSGLFAAAVTPVALAAVTDLSADRPVLGRRLALVSIAGTSGLLLGPPVGAVLAWLQPAGQGSPGPLAVPLLATGLLALVAAAMVAAVVPPGTRHRPATEAAPGARTPQGWLVAGMLGLGLLVSAAVSAFEVGLSLRGGMELDVTSWQIATMFTVCSLTMVVVQAVVFSPLVRPETTRWLIAPGFGVLAAGLYAVPLAGTFLASLLAIGAVAVSAGALAPILTYWIAILSGPRSGAALGRQTSAASLGAALGAAGGGLLHGVTWLPDAGFVLAAAAAVLAVLPSLRLPDMLASRAPVPAPPA